MKLSQYKGQNGLQTHLIKKLYQLHFDGWLHSAFDHAATQVPTDCIVAKWHGLQGMSVASKPLCGLDIYVLPCCCGFLQLQRLHLPI